MNARGQSGTQLTIRACKDPHGMSILVIACAIQIDAKVSTHLQAINLDYKSGAYKTVL